MAPRWARIARAGWQYGDPRCLHSNVRGSENTGPLASSLEVISASFSLPHCTNTSPVHLHLNVISSSISFNPFVHRVLTGLAIVQEICLLQPSGHNSAQKSPHCVSPHGADEGKDDLRAKTHIRHEFQVEDQCYLFDNEEEGDPTEIKWVSEG